MNNWSLNAWWPVAFNVALALLGAAQGLDWVHLLPSGGEYVLLAISALNSALHLKAGAGPLAK